MFGHERDDSADREAFPCDKTPTKPSPRELAEFIAEKLDVYLWWNVKDGWMLSREKKGITVQRHYDKSNNLIPVFSEANFLPIVSLLFALEGMDQDLLLIDVRHAIKSDTATRDIAEVLMGLTKGKEKS